MQELDKGSSGGVQVWHCGLIRLHGGDIYGLTPCTPHGMFWQGFAWFSLRQRKDEDGVIADAFFVESPSGLLMPKQVGGLTVVQGNVLRKY